MNGTPADKAAPQTGGDVDTKSLIGGLEQTGGEGREIICLFSMGAIGLFEVVSLLVQVIQCQNFSTADLV